MNDRQMVRAAFDAAYVSLLEAFDERDHPRGKTSAGTNSGSFRPQAVGRPGSRTGAALQQRLRQVLDPDRPGIKGRAKRQLMTTTDHVGLAHPMVKVALKSLAPVTAGREVRLYDYPDEHDRVAEDEVLISWGDAGDLEEQWALMLSDGILDIGGGSHAPAPGTYPLYDAVTAHNRALRAVETAMFGAPAPSSAARSAPKASMAAQARKLGITMRQEGGDDGYSYVVRHGSRAVSGLTRREATYYRDKFVKDAAAKAREAAFLERGMPRGTRPRTIGRFNPADHPRGKTTPGTNAGSFAPGDPVIGKPGANQGYSPGGPGHFVARSESGVLWVSHGARSDGGGGTHSYKAGEVEMGTHAPDMARRAEHQQRQDRIAQNFGPRLGQKGPSVHVRDGVYHVFDEKGKHVSSHDPSGMMVADAPAYTAARDDALDAFEKLGGDVQQIGRRIPSLPKARRTPSRRS